VKPHLVMLHGWGFDRSCWPSPLIAQLKQHFEVILLNLPGHGEQPLHGLLEHDIEGACVERLDAWIQMQNQALPQRYHLLGWSLGGQVAIRMGHNNACVDRMVLLATNPKFAASDDWPRAMAEQSLVQFAQGYGMNAAKTLRRFASLLALGAKQSKALAMELLPLMQPQASKLVGLALLQTLDERQHLAQLTKACLIELATEDALVPSNWMDAFDAAENILLHQVTGSHAYVLQSQSLGRRIIDFLLPQEQAQELASELTQEALT